MTFGACCVWDGGAGNAIGGVWHARFTTKPSNGLVFRLNVLVPIHRFHYAAPLLLPSYFLEHSYDGASEGMARDRLKTKNGNHMLSEELCR